MRALFILTWLKCNFYSFRLASSSDDLRKVASLRYKIYKENRYISDEVASSGEWMDAYDTYSVSFLALRHGVPIGSLRLVLGSGDLPVEHYFNITLSSKRAEIAEPSRLVIEKNERGGKRLILFGLGYLAYKYSKKSGIKFWYGTLPSKLSGSFRKLGLNFELIDEMAPTAQNLRHRIEIGGYFAKSDLKPYVLNLVEV